MYSDVKNKSLKSNQRFVDGLSNEELDKLMEEFDDYVVEENYNTHQEYGSLTDYIYGKYKNQLFEKFGIQERRSRNLKQDIIEKNPKEVLFLFSNII